MRTMEHEFIGQIIDIFEDFLTDRDVSIRNSGKPREYDGAIIYGSDYDSLSGKLIELIDNWGIRDCLKYRV